MQTTVFIAIWELFLSQGEHRNADLVLLGRAVRRIREQQGLSADALSGAAGIDRGRLEALEGGELDPTYDLLLALAEGLGTQPSALVTLAEELKESSEHP